MTTWTAFRRDRKYLPAEIDGTRDEVELKIEQAFYVRGTTGFVIEAFTDQIDVRLNGRLIATYMA